MQDMATIDKIFLRVYGNAEKQFRAQILELCEGH